jgi:hypothetical protein
MWLWDNPNYTFDPNGILSVTQSIAVTVIADGKSKVYGDETCAYRLLSRKIPQSTLATTATQFSNVGQYPIAVTLE